MGYNVNKRATLDKGTGEVVPSGASTFTIALAASATTNGMDVTVTAVDALGNTIAAITPVEVWMSGASTGIGLTSSAYSGTVTASVGAIHTALTAKKHLSGVTAATGIFTFTIVDTAKPATEYVAVAKPDRRGIVVSGASGANWL